MSAQVPGGLGTWHEIRRSLIVIVGYLFVGGLPDSMAERVFDRLAMNRRAKFKALLDRDPIVERMKVLLNGICSETDIRAGSERFHAWVTEDLWARWQACHKSDWQIRTEVVGLEHVTNALQQGSGIVFWGMSFCGTLFSKIALSRAGVALTQLSAADHGAWYPLTLLGKYVAGPLHCLPEGRYIAERIRIPVVGNGNYLYRLGEVLRSKGCVWIAGERTRAKKLVAAEFLGRSGRFPVGAPMLALRHGAVLLPAYTERLGRLHYRVTIESPVAFDHSMRRKQIVDNAVQDFARRLANQITRNPGDWDWNHLWVTELLAKRGAD